PNVAICGVTRAPFNSNRSSCGIEVVVQFFFYRRAHSRLRVCAKSVFLCRQLPALPPQGFFVSRFRGDRAVTDEQIGAPAFAIPLRTSESGRRGAAGKRACSCKINFRYRKLVPAPTQLGKNWPTLNF